jgi:lactate/malate dehydrogenase, NAD binding domain
LTYGSQPSKHEQQNTKTNAKIFKSRTAQFICPSRPFFCCIVHVCQQDLDMFTTASSTSRRILGTVTSAVNQRLFSSTTAMGKKVAVLGAAGGIGQPLSLLLKLSPNVSELSCYDIVGTPGVAADLSHIPTASTVTGHLPAAGSWPPTTNTGLQAALTGASIVVIPAGVPRKPGMTRDDLFNTNASKL